MSVRLMIFMIESLMVNFVINIRVVKCCGPFLIHTLKKRNYFCGPCAVLNIVRILRHLICDVNCWHQQFRLIRLRMMAYDAAFG